MVEMKCEKCGGLYELTEDEFEEREEHKANDLCPICLEDMFDAQAEKPPKRCFEYKVAMIPSLSTDVEITQGIFDEVSSLNARGQDGWELIQVQGDKAYFKRLYFKE